MVSGPSGFHVVAVAIKDAVAARLATVSPGVPGRACVVPGAIAWDDCECDGGQLAVALDRTFFSESFPVEQTTVIGSACQAPYLVAELTVQVIRCAPQPGEGELAPSCAALEASAQVVTSDAYLTRCGVLDALGELMGDNEIADYMLRPQLVVGPEGACVGSELHVFVSTIW